MNRIKEIYAKYYPLLFTGRVFATAKTMLFIGGSIFIGLWLGLKLFFPTDYILSQINKELFVKDMGLTADSVSLSVFGNLSFHNGQFTEKGEKVFSFGKITVKPSLLDLLSKKISGEIQISDVDNQGGILNLKVTPGEESCYSFKSRDLPLSMIRGFLKDISFSGIVTGEGDVCISDGKYNGNIFLVSDSIIFRGKLPTVMGPVDLGRIDLGSFDFLANIKDGKLEISRLVANGNISLDVAGSVNINSRSIMSSRLDIDVRIALKDMEKINENPAMSILVGLMSQYKVQSEEGSFAMLMRGPAAKPMINRAPAVRKGDEKAEKDDSKSRAQRAREKMTARRKSPAREKKEKPEKETPVESTPAPPAQIETESEIEAQEDSARSKREEERAQEEAERREQEEERREQEAAERRAQEEERRAEIEEARRIAEAQRRSEEAAQAASSLEEDRVEPEIDEVEDI